MSDFPTPAETPIVLSAPVFQRRLLPVSIVETYPNTTNSADLTMIGKGDNGRDYAIKTVGDGNGFVPCSELFCYELAMRLRIGTPDYAILELGGGELAFGSAWEGGVFSINDHIGLVKIVTGQIQVDGLADFFSKVFAFDLFINNIDRHFGNFIFRNSYNAYIALAYDFSRAWYAVDPYGLQCLDPNENTININHLIRGYRLYNSIIAHQTLKNIEDLGGDVITEIFNAIPEQWLPQVERINFLQWWGSDDFFLRMTELRRGL